MRLDIPDSIDCNLLCSITGGDVSEFREPLKLTPTNSNDKTPTGWALLNAKP